MAVFSGTLSAGFVYDARMQILVDSFLHDPANWLSVLTFRVLALDVLDFNRPVHLASLMLDAAVWGREPFGYHLTSILRHALNAVLVWGVTRAVCSLPAGPDAAGPRTAASLLAAAVFACHPLVTEAVCEPTYREDLLVAGFTLAAVLLAMRHALAGVGIAVGCLLEAPWVVRRPGLRRRLVEAATGVVFILAFASMERQKVWVDPVALWTDAWRKNPGGRTPILGLAAALNEAGRPAEAERILEPFVRGPGGAQAAVLVQWSVILEAQGKRGQAHEAAVRAVAADPRFADPARCVADLMLTPEVAAALARALATAGGD